MRKAIGIVVLILCGLAVIIVGAIAWNIDVTDSSSSNEDIKEVAINVDSGWATKSYPDLKFSFSYPSSWTVDTDDANAKEGDALFVASQNPAIDLFKAVFMAVRFDSRVDPYRNDTASEFATHAKRDLEKNEGISFVKGLIKTNAEGRRYYEIDFTKEVEGGQIKGRLVQFYANANTYEMYLMDDEGSFDASIATMDKIAESVRTL